MKFWKHPTGLIFKLESGDMKNTYWRGLIGEVKKFKYSSFNPPEAKEDNCWFIGKQHGQEFLKLKKQLIDDVLDRERQLKAEGFKPIPTVNKNFCRKRIV